MCVCVCIRCALAHHSALAIIVCMCLFCAHRLCKKRTLCDAINAQFCKIKKNVFVRQEIWNLMNKYFMCNMNINEMEKCSIEFGLLRSNLSARFS